MNATMTHQPPPAPSTRDKVEARRNLTIDEVADIFTPTSITAPAEVDPSSTAQIPQPNEMEGRKATNINGEAEFQVIRNWEIKGLTKDYETIVLATADPVTGEQAFGHFMRIYSISSMADRACLLGRKDWVEIMQVQVAQQLGRIKANNGQSTTPGSYKSKVILTSTEAPGVQSGISAAGKKRITWNGHSGFALARYLGKHGWTGAEAVHTFSTLNIPMGKAAVIGGVYAGKAGQRGDPAPVTQQQHQILLGVLSQFRKEKTLKTTNTAEENAVVAEVQKVPETATSTVPSVVQPRKGSKADKEARLAAAMTAKANQRKANKATATAKAIATKAAKK